MSRNMEFKNKFEELFREEFLSPKLTEWLDWAAGTSEQHFVVLPMIQRGSMRAQSTQSMQLYGMRVQKKAVETLGPPRAPWRFRMP